MKKHLLFFFFALAITSASAQNGELYSFMTHHIGDYHMNIENFIRQKDGDFVINTFIGTDSGSPYEPPINIGNIVYKMSQTRLTIIDSLFVEDPNAPYYLFAPNPSGEGNIRASFEYHEDCDSTFLRICHFPDNNLNINHDEDILTPILEGYAFGNYDSHMIDCRGDLIMKYCTIRPDGGYDEYIARFGPDGTLKHQALLFENQNIAVTRLRVFKESPLQYYQWSYDENLFVFVIDSLFNKNTVILNKILREESLSDTIYLVEYEYLKLNIDTEVIPIGGNDVLVAASYTNDTNFDPLHSEHGVAVVKYDLRTMQQKGYIVFNDYPGETEAQCLGLKKMTDGTIYFMYMEEGYPNGNVNVVKMDADLNVEWKRTYKTENIVISAPLYFPIIFEDGQKEEKGIAWVGYGRRPGNDKAGLFYFYLNHDGPANGLDKFGIEVRPYCFYPNPAHDQLHLQYSPDVQPAQVELYDLQGRLVRIQRNNFEHIDMGQLPVGTYTMRVVMEDGKGFSDKVVKE